jgi:hypothetical protein
MTSRSNTDDVAITGTPDVHYNLISVIYHALQGSETYEKYVKDAERSGDRELARFLRDVQQENRHRAERAKELLYERLEHGFGGPRDHDDRDRQGSHQPPVVRVQPAPTPVAVVRPQDDVQHPASTPVATSAGAPQRAVDSGSTTYERGYAAGSDARYASRSFEEVEPELRRSYEAETPAGDPWDRLREQVREGFARAREGQRAGTGR